jgi:hypothetical protein
MVAIEAMNWCSVLLIMGLVGAWCVLSHVLWGLGGVKLVVTIATVPPSMLTAGQPAHWPRCTVCHIDQTAQAASTQEERDPTSTGVVNLVKSRCAAVVSTALRSIEFGRMDDALLAPHAATALAECDDLLTHVEPILKAEDVKLLPDIRAMVLFLRGRDRRDVTPGRLAEVLKKFKTRFDIRATASQNAIDLWATAGRDAHDLIKDQLRSLQVRRGLDYRDRGDSFNGRHRGAGYYRDRDADDRSTGDRDFREPYGTRNSDRGRPYTNGRSFGHNGSGSNDRGHRDGARHDNAAHGLHSIARQFRDRRFPGARAGVY